MGILDDAIREHLDLKRRTGAADDELKQLEDEAFGLPTRPGEPDFPTSETTLADEEPQPEVAEAPSEEIPTGEQATSAQETGEQPPVESVDQPPPAAEAPSEELEFEAEPGTGESLPADEDEEAVAQPAPIFDQSLEDELDLNLDLEDEDPPAIGGEVPFESLETVEHPMHEKLPEPEPEPDPEPDPEPSPPAPAEPLTGEDEELEEAGEEPSDSEDEDVLADTPEFLRDQPEDDELWFEQGAPKDFDFD